MLQGADVEVVLQVFPDLRRIGHDVDAVPAQLRGRADTRYAVQFSADGPETQTFDIPRAAFDALQPGRVYRAYYLPASGKLISIEPIG